MAALRLLRFTEHPSFFPKNSCPVERKLTVGALRNAKIKTRLLVGFGTIMTLLVILTGVGVREVGRIDSSLGQINDVNSVKERYAINFRGSVHDRSIALRDVVLLTEPDAVKATLEQINKLAAFYADSAGPLDAMFADVQSTADTADERAILAAIKQAEARTMPLIRQVIDARTAGDQAKAQRVLTDEARPAFVEWLARINQFIDLEEKKNQDITNVARVTADRFSELMVSLSTVCLVIGVVFAGWTLRSILPLRRLTDVMLDLAGGNLNVVVPEARSGDEVGEITGAVQVFKKNAVEAAELRHAQAEAARLAAETKRSEMAALARNFDEQIKGVVDAVSTSASELRGSAEVLSTTADETERQATTLASSSAQAAASVGTVAAAATQLSASIAEIGRRIDESAHKARQAADQATDTNVIVDGLSAKADRIGDVVKLINSIASQTNLLALNATIEAARAGDAGKGFAVVAGEVKLLANQTSQATSEISDRIAEIQSATGDAVQAIRDIAATITDVNAIAAAIASAVEEQNAATSEIARSVNEASVATRMVSGSIEEARIAASRTGQASSALLSSSGELTRQAEALRTQVDRFLSTMRDAA
jgi:methyl-accepting chemotaxis protein